jgi:hypothetical protein
MSGTTSASNVNLQQYSPDELAIRTILGEAGGEGQTGMTAVGDVLQNRLASGKFGANIYQVDTPSQFNGIDITSPVGSPIYNQAAAAWASAQSGTDVTGGALFFAQPSASSASWAQNLNASNSLQIGSLFFTNNADGTPFVPTNTAAVGGVSSASSGSGGIVGNAIAAAGNWTGGIVGNAIAAAGNWTGVPQALASIDSTAKNLFVRGGIVVMGIMIVGVAVWRFAETQTIVTARA